MSNATKHQTPKNPGSALALRLVQTRSRLDFSPAEMADYLGVPIYTLRKWESGERGSSAAVMRLLDVLGMVEALAPALHESFLPPKSRHVEKSRSTDSIGSSADSVMSKNPV
jgi:transcriptional regulator with XRE-family HTH domain